MTRFRSIVIRGVGGERPVLDGTGLKVDGASSRPRALFQIEADPDVVENLEFRNARNGDNGAGVRVTGANRVTIRGCLIHDCDMGLMSDRCRDLAIESSGICSNGTSLYDGYSHNLYLGGESAAVRHCSNHDAQFGQNFKSRAHYTELWYNRIADSQDGEIGFVDAPETEVANSHAVMVGNLVVSKPRRSG